MVETNLEVIGAMAEAREEENAQFKDFLKRQDAEAIDTLVFELNKKIESQVDCTKCGNCCRTLMINVEQKEADDLQQYLDISKNEFESKYVEKSESGMMVVNTIPCHFLSENKCTVYEHRFADCRNFPNLHLPGFTKRLFATFMHYGRCPIIYNVVEELKRKYSGTL